MKMVVGLGNPGRKYEQTRHNVGFDVLTLLAERWQADSPKSKHQSLISECQIGQAGSTSTACLLVWPQTFMNRSGQAVRSVATFYKTPLEDVLIVCDDFNLPLGKLRLKTQGSAGGQNGLNDILSQMSSDEVPRLRLGIGPTPGGEQTTGFVLGKFAKGERDEAAIMIQTAADAVECWAQQGATEAMNQFN
ncbi:MAG: aminoacyl-tRNA hydrolase [Planctomycetota bacterium]